MGPRAVNFSEEDKVIVNKLNGLLDQLHAPHHIHTVADIGASAFVTLFEGLCGEQLPGINRTAFTREDEVHNCQVVIDSLAGDVLHTSLTHISGAEIIDGDREAISNLIEIFSGLLEYMLNKIDSDASIGNEDEDHNATTDDPDMLSREEIDNILDAELQQERQAANGGPTARWVEESSPTKRSHVNKKQGPNLVLEDLSDVKDSTNDLIKESEALEKRIEQERKILEETRKQKERLLHLSGSNGKMPEMLHRTEAQISQPIGAREAGVVKERDSSRADIIKRIENDPRYKYMLPPTQRETQAADKESDETFKTLQNMVEETAAMARAAVNCSSARAKSMLDTLEDVDVQRRSPRATDLSPSRLWSGVTERSRRDGGQENGWERSKTTKRASPSSGRTSPKHTDKLSDNELTPSRAKRKVSFLVERSLTDSSPSLNTEKLSPTRLTRADAGKPFQRTRASTQAYASGSYLSLDDVSNDKENESYKDKLRKRYEDIVSDLNSIDDASPDTVKATRDYGRAKYRTTVEQPQTLYSVGETHKLVQKEKDLGKKKIGFLQKIYREDFDEILDEAEYLMNRNRTAAKSKEKDYQKKLASVKCTPRISEDNKGPTLLKKKTKKTPPKTCVSSKVKKTSAGCSSVIKPQKKTMVIKDEDDILPMLLDEFPHLHLSLHTWHELWRKGLQQIEQITRAHQEVTRKKSRAQDQLEEAEKRQEIMVNIMKKELEHNQRLKEIKERQVSAITTRNKLHERRMQTARSRHYYDEYQVRMRSKMLKRRTREEMLFKKLFKDGLDIQKERINELRKYAKEQRASQTKAQRDEIESMENYYRDQFQMLADNIAKEKDELEIREKAQQKILDTMKKDLRKKMEIEIKHLQDNLVRDDDDIYFRQLDADRVIHDLKMAKYQVVV